MRGAGVVFGIILILLAFIISPFMLDAFDAWRYTEATTISSLTTGGETTGDITLGHDLYSENLDSVQSISSTNDSDTPAPISYVESTLVLEVGGLEESATRTLTVTYLTDREDNYLPTLATTFPILIVVCILGIGVGVTYRSWRS